MLKIAIVGCGKIADDHAAAIQRIPDCEIIAVCDREPLMARQLMERFRIARHFTDMAALLDEARPDVVHITTPPASHFDLAKLCLEHGCHVYVEKPFTLFHHEAEKLVALAEKAGRKITVGHDAQFGHAARRMRALVASGYLGEVPVHMESYYSYELGQGYARALLGDADHWVRRLPGQLLHNLISHGIARIAEFLTTDSPEVIAYGFTSSFLSGIGETELIDELRVIISDKRTTAFFTFSTQMRPAIQQLRLYGSRNGLVLDTDQEILLKLRGGRFTSYAEKFVPPVLMARQYLSNALTNLGTFMARDFHMKSGMKYLIESFYRSIVNGTEPPIPYREILLTSWIMEAIFAQVQGPSARNHKRMPEPLLAAGSRVRQV